MKKLSTVFLLISVFSHGHLALSQTENDQAKKLSKVSRVLDGATAVLLIDGKVSTVRLIGVDARVKSAEAANCLNAQIGGNDVFIEYDPDFAIGEGGPTPVYLYRGADRVFVNLEMVRRGCCLADTDRPFKYAREFRLAEREAEKARKGLWESSVEQKPSDREQRYHEPKAGDRLNLFQKGGGRVLALNDLDAATALMYAEQHGYEIEGVYATLEKQERVSIVKSDTVVIYEDARSQVARTNTLSGLPCSHGTLFGSDEPCLQWIKVRLPSGRSVWVTSEHLYVRQ